MPGGPPPPVTAPLSTAQEVWRLLQPWIGLQNVTSFKFELDVDEEPRITVEYYPDQVTAECLAVLLKQFKLVPVDAKTDRDHQTAGTAGP